MSREINSVYDLIPDERNPNRGTQRGLKVLEDSLRELGAGRGVVIDKNGRIIAGNKTVQTAADIGLTDVVIVKTAGDKLIVTQRDDLELDADDGKARRLSLSDNRSSEVSLDWDEEILAGLLSEDEKLLDELWYEEELDDLLGDLLEQEVLEDPGPQVDRAQELQEKWQVQRGQVWEIGRHRLMCGNSTNDGDVARLMDEKKVDGVYTDPPFGYGKRIAADETIEEALSAYGYGMQNAARHSKKDVWAIVDTPKRYIKEFIRVSEDIGWLPREPVLYMYRNSMANGPYGVNIFELAFVYAKGTPKVYHRHLNAVDVSRWSGFDPLHPLEKIPETYRHFFELFFVPNALVLDLFLGSGTTMIVAEQTGRLCYGMEISPKYCSVVLERMSALGLDPQLVDE